MKKIALILVVVAFSFMGCGETKKEESKQADTPKEEVKKPVEEEETTNNDVTIEANDNMRYSIKRIVVKGGEKVKITLKHTGTQSKDVMGHNLVILKKETKMSEFAQKANTAKETDYIPADSEDAIVAHTKMIGGGEETVIEFDAPEVGEYNFICSFPAHHAIMKGKFIVK